MIKTFHDEYVAICVDGKNHKLNKIDYLRDPLAKIFDFGEFFNLIEKVTITDTIDVEVTLGCKKITLHFPLGERFIECFHVIITENLIVADKALCNQIKKSLTVPLHFDKKAKFLKLKISLPNRSVYSPGFYFKFTMANFSEYIFPEFEYSISLTMPFDENIIISTNDDGCHHYNTDELKLKIIITHYK